MSESALLLSPNIEDGDTSGNTPLIQAVRDRDILRAQKLINEGANPNRQSKRHETALIVAVWGRDIEMVQLLVNYGANPNLHSKKYDIPLMVAVWIHEAKIIEFLVKNGADVNLPNHKGITALTVAVWGGDISMAQFLVDNGADANLHCAYAKLPNIYGNSALEEAAKRKNFGMIKMFCDAGIDISAVYDTIEKYGAEEEVKAKAGTLTSDFNTSPLKDVLLYIREKKSTATPLAPIVPVTGLSNTL
ncbi:MAG: ankyrin repeat domain-containing protein [Pseudomonadota bacterium]